MNWDVNEWMFYGGIAAAGLALFGICIYALISRIAALRLRKKLDREYGETLD